MDGIVFGIKKFDIENSIRFGIEKKIGFGIENIWYKKISDLVSKKFGIGKKLLGIVAHWTGGRLLFL